MPKKQDDDTKPISERNLRRILVETLAEFWEQVAFPMIDSKIDTIVVTKQINSIKTDIKDIKRTTIDLKTDTPTMNEFNHLDKRVSRLETQVLN